GARRSAEDFEVAATAPFIISDDLDAAADSLRPFYALYFGGMGAKGTNFHANVAIQMGYGSEVEEIAQLYLSGNKDEAAAKGPRSVRRYSTVGGLEGITVRATSPAASRSRRRSESIRGEIPATASANSLKRSAPVRAA